MTSRESDLADRRHRARAADAALAADRAGRGRLRDLADRQVPPSHGDPPRSSHVPGTNREARP